MKTPPDILQKFEQASIGLEYGTVKLTLSITQGQSRYFITRKESFQQREKRSTSDDFNADQLALSRLLNNQKDHEKNYEKPSDN